MVLRKTPCLGCPSGAEVPGRRFGGLHPHALPAGTPRPHPERAEDTEIQITEKLPVNAALWPPASWLHSQEHSYTQDGALIYSCLFWSLLLERKAII